MAATTAVSPNWPANEIPEQVRLVRKESGDNGFIFYNASSLLGDTSRAQELRRNLLASFDNQPALIPASPWLGGTLPAKPNLMIADSPNGVRVNWNPASTNSVHWWIVQTKSSGNWKTEVFPRQTSAESLIVKPEAVAVTAVDRLGNVSAPQVLEVKRNSAAQRILLKP
jgi:hypothetical protein